MTPLDRDACYRALAARDRRFDGRFFVGVRTTGVYCRPICPARTPKPTSVRFYRSAAAAERDGYRACLRCRPESSPQLAAWRGTSNTTSRALSLIAEGALDTGDVEGLAARLGVGERQLRRLFRTHLGTSPVAVAQTRRLLFAKQLLHETALPISDVADAAGFGSLRRFNEIFRARYGRPPSQLRRRRSVDAEGEPPTLRLAYAPPYDWGAMLASLAARANPEVEEIAGEVYRRTIELQGARGTLELRPIPGADALALRIRFPRIAAFGTIVSRVRRMFDLDADLEAIHATLGRDPFLRRRIDARPGIRVPGAWGDLPGDPDAFPTTDDALVARAEAWRPWRAYAARLLTA